MKAIPFTAARNYTPKICHFLPGKKDIHIKFALTKACFFLSSSIKSSLYGQIEQEHIDRRPKKIHNNAFTKSEFLGSIYISMVRCFFFKFQI